MVVTYLRESEEVQFEVDMENNTYLSIGFGYDMDGVDMIGWHGDGDTAKAVDYWSIGKRTPVTDAVNNLDSTYEISADKKRVKFVTKRKLDTGDLTEDYLIPLNEEIDLVWALNLGDSDWIIHTIWGRFRETFHDTLGNLPLVKTATITTTSESDDGDCLKNSWGDF